MYNKGYILKISLILLGMFIISILDSCRKKAKEDEYCYMPNEFKDYTVFTSGDYWVYRNNFGEKDSIVLIDQEIKQVTDNDLIYDLLNQLFTKNNTDTFRVFSMFIVDENKNYYVLLTDNSILFFNGAVGEYCKIGLYFSSNELKLVDKIDTLIYNSNMYFDNIVFEDTISSYYDFKKNIYSRNVGLIKKEDFDGTIWELESYSVNQ